MCISHFLVPLEKIYKRWMISAVSNSLAVRLPIAHENEINDFKILSKISIILELYITSWFLPLELKKVKMSSS